MAKPKPKPIAFTREIAEDICAWVSSGKSVTAYCRQPNTVCKSTVFNKLASEEWFVEMFEKAAQARAHAVVDELIDIADNTPDPAVARNRIHARQWYAGKMHNKYADKQKIEHEGGITVEIVHFGPKTDDDKD